MTCDGRTGALNLKMLSLLLVVLASGAQVRLRQTKKSIRRR